MCWFLAAATRRCARRSLRARLAAACCCSSARRGIFLIRGTPYNTGRVLRMLMDAGAKTIGDPTQGHSVAIDARAPKFDGGICTRVDCVSLGVVVNRNAERFYDEGEDFWFVSGRSASGSLLPGSALDLDLNLLAQSTRCLDQRIQSHRNIARIQYAVELRATGRHLPCHVQLCELGRMHAFLQLFCEGALERLRLNLLEDTFLFQKVVEP